MGDEMHSSAQCDKKVFEKCECTYIVHAYKYYQAVVVHNWIMH